MGEGGSCLLGPINPPFPTFTFIFPPFGSNLNPTLHLSPSPLDVWFRKAVSRKCPLFGVHVAEAKIKRCGANRARRRGSSGEGKARYRKKEKRGLHKVCEMEKLVARLRRMKGGMDGIARIFFFHDFFPLETNSNRVITRSVNRDRSGGKIRSKFNFFPLPSHNGSFNFIATWDWHSPSRSSHQRRGCFCGSSNTEILLTRGFRRSFSKE